MTKSTLKPSLKATPRGSVLALSHGDRMTICARAELERAKREAAARWRVPEHAIHVTPLSP